MDDLPDLDSLFRLPLAEFTAARNALASQLSKSGQKEAAARVKALTKPPVSAWVVNQLYWRERSWFDRLIASGALLRQAQASGFAGQVANLQEPLKAQRDALNELSRRALVFLSQEGHGANADVLRRVTLDLEGLAAREPLPDGPQPGRLTSDVDAPGFEALAALVPKATGSPSRTGSGSTQPSRVLSFIHNRRPAAGAAPKAGATRRDDVRKEQEKVRAAAAKQALKVAEKNLVDARRVAAKSEAAMKSAAARLKDAERVRQQAEKELEKAAAAADAARQAARRTASDAADAAQALDDAERALAQARARN